MVCIRYKIGDLLTDKYIRSNNLWSVWEVIYCYEDTPNGSYYWLKNIYHISDYSSYMGKNMDVYEENHLFMLGVDRLSESDRVILLTKLL